jgi:predicted DCC family thiol-disulfide oxidoreductase YuxK
MSDPQLPQYDNSRPLFVFDGHCVLCSGGASWLMRFDLKGKLAFASAQSPLGEALYAHFAQDFDDTYMLVEGGKAYVKSDGYLRLCAILGGPWHLLRIFALVPRPIRDWAYGLVARNRYRWFGKTDLCVLLTPEQRERLL